MKLYKTNVVLDRCGSITLPMELLNPETVREVMRKEGYFV